MALMGLICFLLRGAKYLINRRCVLKLVNRKCENKYFHTCVLCPHFRKTIPGSLIQARFIDKTMIAVMIL